MVKLTKYISIFITVLLCLVGAMMFMNGYFTDQDKLALLLKDTGIFAPLIFIFLQAFQVVIPIIPGGVSSTIGVMIFGAINGFIYNYIGLIIGAFISFWIIRTYGEQFLLKFIDEDKFYHYQAYLDHKSFDIIFALALFIPGLPDDILCIVAALSPMSLKKYMLINITMRPLVLSLYSFGIGSIMTFIQNLF